MMEFCKDVWYGHILKGDLREAVAYLAEFPEQRQRLERYEAVFVREEYIDFDVPAALNEILGAYQRYWRDVFWLGFSREEAAEILAERLETEDLDLQEAQVLPERFRAEGLHFLGGRTAGYYGPYVWRDTREQVCEVELPGGVRAYPVRLLDGFVMKGWIDFLSFGEVGTGGWTDGDGIINCVRASYDLDSEQFQVSLLKHEAQHAVDLEAGITDSGELEYRAKLVELIYTGERKLLPQFACEADDSDPCNGHGLAAHRIAEGFARALGHREFDAVPIGQVQSIARELFWQAK